MIDRPNYLNFLIEWKDLEVIKVISGVRRSGKSTILQLYKNYLLQNGVDENQIISINFEDPDYEGLWNYKSLYDYVKSKMVSGKKNYIFLDEIQHVEHFERAVDGLFIKENADVYITGSNAYFMSGELATLLSGRYVELKMLPLSFKEFYSALDGKNLTKEEAYNLYITNSSFPYTLELKSSEQIRTYHEGLFNTIVLNDIVQRYRVADVDALKSVISFMFDNIGNLCTPKKVSDTLASNNRKISNHTVENYINAIVSSLLMYNVGRFDVKGKQHLQLLEKYYLVDVGLRHYLFGSSNIDRGRILENVVFLELKRRGYYVYVGKFGSQEVDFVVRDINGNVSYYQVAFTVRDEETLKRELLPLQNIQDHNGKYLLTMDVDPEISYDGIKQINVLTWLLS